MIGGASRTALRPGPGRLRRSSAIATVAPNPARPTTGSQIIVAPDPGACWSLIVAPGVAGAARYADRGSVAVPFRGAALSGAVDNGAANGRAVPVSACSR